MAREDLEGQLERYVEAHRRKILGVLENLWDKYRVSMEQIERERHSAAKQLQKLLKRLGYTAEGVQVWSDPPLPPGWDLVPVRMAGEVRLGRSCFPRHQSGRHTTPYLRVANVYDGLIDYSDVLGMDFTAAEREIYGLMPGDVLLNEGQSLELVGRSAIYEGEPGAYCFQNTLVRFRCNETTIPAYCQAVFKYWLDTGRFTKVARQTTLIAHLVAPPVRRDDVPPSKQNHTKVDCRNIEFGDVVDWCPSIACR